MIAFPGGTIYHVRSKVGTTMSGEKLSAKTSSIINKMRSRGLPAAMLIPQQGSDIVFVTGSLAHERDILISSLPEPWQDSLRELDYQLRQQPGLNIYV